MIAGKCYTYGKKMKEINNWEIKTPDGWKPFKGIRSNGIHKLFRITFNDGKEVTATEDHGFFTNNEKIQVKDIITGTILDGVGVEYVVSKIEEIESKEVYDIVESYKHKFVVNNALISSNCDEFAFVPANMAEDFWKSNYPTVASNGGKIILVSTPKGAVGKFYEIYTKAEKDENDFEPIKVTWDQVPGRDEVWKEKTIKELGIIGFQQEHNCSFTGSTTTLINGDFLGAMKYIPPPFLMGEGYVIWKKPESKKIYVAGIDVGAGTNSDYSLMNIFDATDYTVSGKYEQVAMLRRNDLSIFDFGVELLRVAKTWNDALLVIENNATGLGSVLAKQLYFEDGYENVYYEAEKGEYGVNANRKTKALALVFFKSDIEDKRMKIVSQEMIEELGYYEEQKDGIFAARKGNNFHDDTVSSGYWVSYSLRQPWIQERLAWFLDQIGKGKVINKNKEELEDEGIADAFTASLRNNNSELDFHEELWKEDLN